MDCHGGQCGRPFLRARLRLDLRYRTEVEQARAHSVPHSIFTGRRLPGPGEPLFLEEDTAAAVALAEEERDTCPACGQPKAWCRTPDGEQGMARFEIHEERCWATYRLALYRGGDNWKNKHDDTKQATQLSTRFRKGHEPALDAGLDID